MLPSSKTTLMPVKVPVKGKSKTYYSTRYKKISEEESFTIKINKEIETAIATYIKIYKFSNKNKEHKFEKINDNVQVYKGSANGVFLIKDNENKKGIFKPVGLENNLIRKNKLNDNFAQREILAYKIYNIFKDNLKFLFPKTKKTRIAGYDGTLQEFVDAMSIDEYKKYLDSQGKYMFWEIDIEPFIDLQIFDFVIANDDRHFGNLLIDKEGKLYAIDNSLSFPSKLEKYGYRTRGSLAHFIVSYIEGTDDILEYEYYSKELQMTVYKRISPAFIKKIKERIKRTATSFLEKENIILETVKKEFKKDEELPFIIEQLEKGFNKLKEVISFNEREDIALAIPQ